MSSFDTSFVESLQSPSNPIQDVNGGLVPHLAIRARRQAVRGLAVDDGGSSEIRLFGASVDLEDVGPTAFSHGFREGVLDIALSPPAAIQTGTFATYCNSDRIPMTARSIASSSIPVDVSDVSHSLSPPTYLA